MVASVPTDGHEVDVLGVDCAVVDVDGAAQHVVDLVRRAEGGYISTCNVHVVVTAGRDCRYRAALDGAALRVPDGWPVAWMQRRQGARSARRVPGPELMERTLKAGEQDGLSHFLLGSTEPVLADLEAEVKRRFPKVKIGGTYSPPFEPLSPMPNPEVVDRIRSAAPSVVWVGLGAPKQDFWMRMYADRLAPSVLIGVGAAFEFLSGARPRAPLWMRRSGLEWAHRLGAEPRRLTGRYVSTNTEFLARAGYGLIRARRPW